MMSQSYDVILKSGTVVNQDGEGVRDIAVANGRIAEIGNLGSASAAEVIDCKGLHILPGVMDTQVHFREPGLTHKEDLETGSRSAVMGGVTAVFEMPNTDPLTVTAAAFSDKIRRGHHRMHCDFAFFIGGTCRNWNARPVAPASRCSSARRPARFWSRMTKACGGFFK
jgi:dihydroorotase